MSQLLDPYAPPAAPPAATVPSRLPSGLALKWAYLSIVAIRLPLTMVAAQVTDAKLQVLAAAPMMILGLTLIAIGMIWLHGAWSEVRADAREGTTPGGVVIAFFIPVYNFYWAFAANTHLCAILNRRLEAASSPLRAPAAVAVFGVCGYWIVAVLNAVGLGVAGAIAAAFVGVLWFVYMLKGDEARAEVLKAEGAAARGA